MTTPRTTTNDPPPPPQQQQQPPAAAALSLSSWTPEEATTDPPPVMEPNEHEHENPNDTRSMTIPVLLRPYHAMIAQSYLRLLPVTTQEEKEEETAVLLHRMRKAMMQPPETCTTTTTAAAATLSARELAIFREGLRLARCCASTTLGSHYQQQRKAVDEAVEREKEAEPIRTPITAATRPPPQLQSLRALSIARSRDDVDAEKTDPTTTAAAKVKACLAALSQAVANAEAAAELIANEAAERERKRNEAAQEKKQEKEAERENNKRKRNAAQPQQQTTGGRNGSATGGRNGSATGGRNGIAVASDAAANNNRAFESDVVHPQQQSTDRWNTGRGGNPYGNNVSDIDYYRDAYNRSMALRAEETKQHKTELDGAQTAYDGVCNELESTKNKLRVMEMKERKMPPQQQITPPVPQRKGAWNEEETNLFIDGLRIYGEGDWKSICEHVKSRGRKQTANFAFNYFKRLEKTQLMTGSITADQTSGRNKSTDRNAMDVEVHPQPQRGGNEEAISEFDNDDSDDSDDSEEETTDDDDDSDSEEDTTDDEGDEQETIVSKTAASCDAHLVNRTAATHTDPPTGTTTDGPIKAPAAGLKTRGLEEIGADVSAPPAAGPTNSSSSLLLSSALPPGKSLIITPSPTARSSRRCGKKTKRQQPPTARTELDVAMTEKKRRTKKDSKKKSKKKKKIRKKRKNVKAKRDNETDEEHRFRLKRDQLSISFWGMLFSYYNKKYNPPFLYGEDFDKSDFPIRMTDARVLDRFTQWVLDAKHDQLTGLPFVGKLSPSVDHRHGVPKDSRMVSYSQDGTFRCLCNLVINSAIGHLENAIVANSNQDVDGTDAITPPYDVTNDKNATFLFDLHDLLTVTTPKLREEWIRDPLAKTIRGEVFLRNEKICMRRNKKTTKFLSGEWSKVEDDNLAKGISEKGWSNWTLISGYHVQTRSSDQVGQRAHRLFELKDGIMVRKDKKKKRVSLPQPAAAVFPATGTVEKESS